jgi:hypothetical protein
MKYAIMNATISRITDVNAFFIASPKNKPSTNNRSTVISWLKGSRNVGYAIVDHFNYNV